MKEFKTISQNSSKEIIEKKSRFIANAFYIETIVQAEEYLEIIRKINSEAKHHCFAYSIITESGIVDRFSDDGEPSGTAGSPILNIIKKREINNILVVVTRYFGGILLGTGGLIRAYSNVTQKALDEVQIINKILGLNVTFEIEYKDFEKFKHYLKQKKIYIQNVEYTKSVRVNVDISKKELSRILVKTKELYFKILKYDIIEEKNIAVNINI